MPPKDPATALLSTISTEACLAYLEDSQRQLPEGAMDEVRAHMRALEQRTGKRFGGSDEPGHEAFLLPAAQQLLQGFADQLRARLTAVAGLLAQSALQLVGQSQAERCHA